MNNMKNYIKNAFGLLALFVAGLLVLASCKEDDEVFPRTRLFRPVLNEALYAIDNTIVLDMGNMKEAQSYTVQISRDSFQTVDYTFETDTSYVEIDEEVLGEELLWFTIYQVQATAHADDPEYDSKVSELGNVRTQKFPSNMGAPSPFDVTDTRARVFWVSSGAPITQVKVFAINDLRLENALLEFDVTDEERAENEKVIAGLSPMTEYQVAIYSPDRVRGWEVYQTREALVSGDNVIDLLGIADEDILVDTLQYVADGSIILLEGGRTYNAGGYAFEKSVTIRSGYSFTPAFPLIHCGSNYNIADGSNVDSLIFRDVAFSGDFGGNYVFNIDKSGSIGEIKFDNTRIHSLRGITRIKGGTGMLEKYTIINSVVDSINGYGVLAVDTDGWMAGDILLKNSTFSKSQYFLVSRTNTESLTIESCTIYGAPENGRQLLRWRGSDGNNNITNGVKIYNSIFGPGWDMSDGGNTGIDGYDGLGSTTFDVVNTYGTIDFVYADGKDEIPGLPSFVYPGTAAQLWVNPDDVNFSIKDPSFAGKGDTGDPRWRIGL
jgi:hypothetical protein